MGPGSFAVPVEILRNPRIPATSFGEGGLAVLLGLQLSTESSGLGGLAGMVGAQPGGFVPPFPIRIDELDEPERRPAFSVERGHFASAVSAVNLLHSYRKAQ